MVLLKIARVPKLRHSYMKSLNEKTLVTHPKVGTLLQSSAFDTILTLGFGVTQDTFTTEVEPHVKILKSFQKSNIPHSILPISVSNEAPDVLLPLSEMLMRFRD